MVVVISQFSLVRKQRGKKTEVQLAVQVLYWSEAVISTYIVT